MTLEIIRYITKYQEAVVDLWKKCNLLVPQNDPVEDIQKKIEFQPNLFFIALEDGKLIGSVMVGYEGHRGWMNYLAVLPTYQKRGYGRRLVDKAIEELIKLGCLKINLQVRRGNISAVEFYKHLGFREDNVISLGKRLKKV
jgi:ribosomal protein S18 acetylase RimI-like enzyme